ncbi:MAG: hypothetical protein EBV34_18675 [Betaproteobacteria bacterium]|nr:hypothetical protein [Betaproteobacteria bacterium]
MIDLRHPLAVLASHMPWQAIEASLAKQLAREFKKGRNIQEVRGRTFWIPDCDRGWRSAVLATI